MCQNCVAMQQDSLLVGLTKTHADVLQRETTLPHKGIVNQLFSALTTSLSPHLPVLATFVAMAEFASQKKFGILREHRVVRVPLSIIGHDRVRYRTPILNLLHEAVLSFRMSEVTVKNVESVLRGNGFAVAYLCSCGLVMGSVPAVDAFVKSQTIRRLDRLRSAIDTEGNPVTEVRHWTDIPTNMDLSVSGEDEALLERISDLTLLMAKTNTRPDYSWIEDELKYFLNSALQETATA